MAGEQTKRIMIPAGLLTALNDSYRIERELGAGGMATVYLARDLRHDRLVALKVLRPDLAAVLGADRFLAEVRTTANLQHPHILGLIDSGQAAGAVYYVMPYVAGESLRDRLTREKQLPVDDALRITTEVAHALDYAHRHGVIHRDVKPENILLQDGQAMVADFGIALAGTQATGGRMTETGMSLGTPQYMSPEQALGERDLTPRSDQYALACVLFELLAGEPPFTGPTVQSIVARVMTAEPEAITGRRSSTPPAVAAALARALQKVPADRFKSCGEFAEALRASPASGAAPNGTISAPARVASIPWLATSAGGLGLLALGALGSRVLWDTSKPKEVVRFEVSLPPDLRLPQLTTGRPFNISPDGRTLVFAAVDSDSQAGSERATGIYTRALDALEPRMVATGTARFLSFSRDGQALAYLAGSSVMRVSVNGGSPTRLGEVSQYVRGISWGAAGIVVGATTGGLLFFPNDGSAPRAITSVKGDSLVWHMHPLVLADEDHVVFTVRRGADVQLAITSLADSTVTSLGVGASPVGTVGDRLLYTGRDGAVMAAQLDAGRRTLGKPVSTGITADVEPDLGSTVAYSSAGTLVYSTGGQLSVPFVVTNNGAEQRIPVEPRAFVTARFSPDGSRVAFDAARMGASDIWVLNRQTGTMGRLTTDDSPGLSPEWSADGRRVLYVRPKSAFEVWERVADGSAPASLVQRPPFEALESVISPDGKWIAYRTLASVRRMRDVVALPLDSTDQREIVVEAGPFNEYGPRFSRDGRWIAYSSNESGRSEIYVRPFPGPGPRVQVTSAGGSWPVWGGSGRTLYFARNNEVLRVGTRADDQFLVTSSPVLVARRVFGGTSHAPYDVSRDETELVILRPQRDAPFTVVLNWSAEFLGGASPAR